MTSAGGMWRARRWRGVVAAWMLALGAIGLAPLPALGQPQSLRVEPPSWWVGMRQARLELLVHAPGLADWQVELTPYPGVRLVSSRAGDSANYRFVTLEIGSQARAGWLELRFTHGAQVHTHRYELAARRPGSAQRRGFDASDVILNLVPDRFANGDPINDNHPGYGDPANRADIQAGRHGGDLAGIAAHLEYFAGMGYTMLWPTPLMENRQPRYSYHGYAVTDLYRVDPRLGSNAQYRAMVAQARERGIGVIQDVVLNHVGSGHPWTADPPMRDWYTQGGRFVATRHARTAVADPYAAASDRENFTQGWFEPNMPDLNQRNPHLATYLVQNAIWWVEFADLSGLRVDTYGYSDTAFLAQWSQALMAEYPALNLVGEEWSGNPVVVAQWQRGQAPQLAVPGGGSQLPSLMDFPLHYVLRRALASGDSWNGGLTELYEALINDRLYPDPDRMVLFEGNHDVPRLYSAMGEDLALTKMALAYVLTMRGIPQLYYGTEVLMTSPRQRDDGATRQDFPGGWAGDAVNARTGEGLSVAQRDMQAFLRRLMNWRRTQSVVHRGRLMHYAPENGVYTYFRYEGDRQVMVVFNKNGSDASVDTRRYTERLRAGASGVDVISGERLTLWPALAMPARSVRVIELD